MVILLTIVVGTFIININRQQIKMTTNLSIDYNMQQATLLSQSGIYYGAKKTIATNINSFEQLNVKNINNIQNSIRDLYFTKLNNYQYEIKSIAKVYDSKCSTYAVVRRMPYSQYALFVNTFPSNSYYGTGQIFNGPIYVNGSLGIGQIPGPIFYDNVYCTKEVKYYNNTSKKNFKGFKSDLYQNYDYLNMPSDKTKLGLSSKINQAYNIDNVKNIILNNDKVLLTYKNNTAAAVEIDKLKLPFLYKSINQPIYIKGVLDRELTIGTQGIVYIVDNIMYKDINYDKQQLYSLDQSSNSLLTIMSNENIIIHESANLNTINTTYNVVVCANLFTTKSIIVNQNDFQWIGTNLGGGKYSKKIRKFIVFGSRTQNTMDSKTYDGKLQYGLAQSIMYDKRMKFRVPIGMTAPNRSLKFINWHQIKFYGVK